jgi:hypothetical protein
MSASSTALKAAYTTEVAKIDDTLTNAEATYLLDRWIEALDKQNELEANNITSYSIAGRTVTRSNISEGQEACNQLRAQLFQMIYGSASLVDLNSEIAEPSGVN